jgi:serine/threonine-protein kinase PknG
MTACTRPGCSGRIEDGFCAVCGLAPDQAAQPPAAPGPARQPAGQSGTCTRPGCAGDIEDGFCAVCGLAPDQAAQPPAATRSSSVTSARTPTASGTARATSRGSSRTGRSSRGSRASRRGRLGAGLVEVPPVPRRDPAEALLPNPEVAERKRFCGNCDAPVGRGKDGKPGRTEGFCPKCGSRYSFTPKLKAGEVVGGQYEVLGCLAHGGLGWIYLARDRNVNGRWVVLKGLLDTGDVEAMQAAIAERRFLAEVEHPNIVRIYNFVQHPDPQDGTLVGYIVMEYVGGRSLKELRGERDASGQLVPLPLGQAIAYALEVLPALGYLHAQGLLYCDFKPDNVIQSEEQLKLIDLGAVRRIDDFDSPLYKTDGYCAPELGNEGPSIESDLYTVARTLAVLTFNFDYLRAHQHSLPDPAAVPLLADHPSFHRFLRRSGDPDPDRRFESAQSMAEQLTGVLREVLATQDGNPRPGLSGVFSLERRVFGAEADNWPAPLDPVTVAAALPIPQVDTADPAAGFLATVAALDQSRLVSALKAAPVQTSEVRFKLAQALIETGDSPAGLAVLKQLDADEPGDWRVLWHRGLAALIAGDPGAAAGHFDEVYTMLPGEAAAKLALAAGQEILGATGSAAALYRLVWRTDRTFTSAAFGLARVLLAEGNRAEAIGVLESVPDTSSHHVNAQLAAIRTRAAGCAVGELPEQELFVAAQELSGLDLEPRRRTWVTIEVLSAAHSRVLAGASTAPPGVTVLGCRLTDRDLRAGLERGYRTLARLADARPHKVELVELANLIRPITWV